MRFSKSAVRGLRTPLSIRTTHYYSLYQVMSAAPTSAAGSKKNSRRQDAPDVTLSKKLSYLLRHGAVKERLSIGQDGFASIDDLLKNNRFKKTLFKDITRIVAADSKSRYKLEYRGNPENEEASKTTGQDWYIRANQGHSIEVGNLEIIDITDYNECPIAIHGTYLDMWNSHIRSEGLSKMKRNHIHMASGMPGDDGVISGMRASADVFIYVNVRKAMEDGICFGRSANGVILTEGKDGFIGPQYFEKVLTKKGESLL
ncbi:KptA family-domain-containing protein [Limtongia smithiae]|uniref:KptA family-domain-containing protein n=1 Tax=Limtongia smithiae TaxID=1125753 RepID=UPI0034CE34B8